MVISIIAGKMISCKKKLQRAAFILPFALAVLFIFSSPVPAAERILAPDFSAVGSDGKNFSLSDHLGSPIILHITNIEVPLCVECEKSLQGQVEELAALKAMDPDVQIVTLNLRKNPYSRDGRSLAEKWWKVNITWPWTEDIEPYSIGSKYLDYWNVQGGSSNPTLLLIDKEGYIAGVYHVYRVGEGEIDGVQKAKTLYQKLQDVSGSQWKGLEGEVSRQDFSAFYMFSAGILTSLAPCSIALMIAVFSYVLTVKRKDEYLRKSASTSKEGFVMGIAFTLGMAAVFFVLGLFISQMGLFIRDSKIFDLAQKEPAAKVGGGLARPVQALRLHRSLHFGHLLRPGLGPLCSVHGAAGPDLAGLAGCDAPDGRHYALHLRRRAWSAHYSHCHLLPDGGRKDRGEVRLHRGLDHQVLRAAGDIGGRGVCGAVCRIFAVVKPGCAGPSLRAYHESEAGPGRSDTVVRG